MEAYCRHESGRTPIPRRAAKIYAHAYRCPEAALDPSLEHVAIPEEELLDGRARDASEVHAFLDTLDRPTACAALAIDWLPVLSGSTALLGRLGREAVDCYRPRAFFPVPKGWGCGRNGAPASELAVVEIALDTAAPSEPPSLLVVRLRQVAAADDTPIRLLVTEAGCVASEPRREDEALRRLRGTAVDGATRDEPIRLPVLGILLAGASLPRTRSGPILDLGILDIREPEDSIREGLSPASSMLPS